MKTFEIDGYTVKITVHHDESMGAPWDEHDGHGPVSEWERRDKRPGELILCEDRRARRFYDFAGAMKLAKRDGWGLSAENLAKLETKLRRKANAGEIRAAAVREDFEHLRRWCAGDWQWLGFTTEIETPEGETIEGESVWGYDDEKYMLQDAEESARAIVAGLLALQSETLVAEAMP